MSKKWELYDTSGGSIKRKRRSCPKCGVGVYMAQHKDRLSCGKCGYTEFTKTPVKTEEGHTKTEEKSIGEKQEKIEKKPSKTKEEKPKKETPKDKPEKKPEEPPKT